MVGMVVTTSPNLSLYKMVVFPAASNPTIKNSHLFFAEHTTPKFRESETHHEKWKEKENGERGREKRQTNYGRSTQIQRPEVNDRDRK